MSLNPCLRLEYWSHIMQTAALLIMRSLYSTVINGPGSDLDYLGHYKKTLID